MLSVFRSGGKSLVSLVLVLPLRLLNDPSSMPVVLVTCQWKEIWYLGETCGELSMAHRGRCLIWDVAWLLSGSVAWPHGFGGRNASVY